VALIMAVEQLEAEHEPVAEVTVQGDMAMEICVPLQVQSGGLGRHSVGPTMGTRTAGLVQTT
jgi:hypothetical protein